MLSYFVQEKQKDLIPIIASLLMFYRNSITVGIQAWIGISRNISMGMVYFLSVGLFLLWLLTRHKMRVGIQIIPLLVMGVLCICSFLFFRNDYGTEMILDFFKYCVPASIMIMYVDNYIFMLKAYGWISLIVFFICGFLPFISGPISYLDMGYFSSGMNYGEWVITPCFIGIYILRRLYNMKWIYLPEFVCLGISLLFANRGSILTCVFFWGMYEVIVEKKKDKKTILKWIFLLMISIFVFIRLEEILVFIQNVVLTQLGVSSRALRKYLNVLQNQNASPTYMLSGRDYVNAAALEILKHLPFGGIGIGTFYQRTGFVYTHNIITDALTTFGVLGAYFLLIVLITTVRVFKVPNKPARMMMVMLFAQWFPRLLLSKSFVNDVYFWIFITFALKSRFAVYHGFRVIKAN